MAVAARGLRGRGCSLGTISDDADRKLARSGLPSVAVGSGVANSDRRSAGFGAVALGKASAVPARGGCRGGGREGGAREHRLGRGARTSRLLLAPMAGGEPVASDPGDYFGCRDADFGLSTRTRPVGCSWRTGRRG